MHNKQNLPRELDAITALAADRLNAPMAFITVAKNGELRAQSAYGVDRRSMKRPLSQTVCHWVMETGEPLIVEDLRADSRFEGTDCQIEEGSAIAYAGIPIVDEDGNVTGVLCVVDTKPRCFDARQVRALNIMAEQARFHVEIGDLRRIKRFADIIDGTTSDAFVVCDQDGSIQHWNGVAERLFGWPAQEALGQNIEMIVPEPLRNAHGEGVRRIAANPDSKPMGVVEVDALRKDGTLVPVELTLGVHRHNGVCAIVSIIRDISARRAAEDHHTLQRKITETIIENVPAAIYAKEATTGRYLFVNRAYEQATGIDRNTIVGRTAAEMFPSDHVEEVEREERDLVDDPVCTERIVPLPDGRERQIVMTKVRARSPGGGHMVLGFAQDVTEERAAAARISYLALHDPLTGLLNRTRFMERLEDACRSGPVAVVILDLDRFKIVNDLYGHGAGDEVLLETAKRLRDVSGGEVARLGGDEFAIIIRDVQAASRIARRCVEALAKPYGIHDRGVGIGASAGIAVRSDKEESDADHLMRNADLALYRAKREGRNRTCFFEPAMDDAARERRHVEAQLREAISNGDIHVEYQPLARTRDGRIISFEALARWNHPELGVITPAMFIPIAEESGMMPALGRQVLEKAAREAATWNSEIRIAVNLSPAQLEDDGIVDEIANVLSLTGLAPMRLEIEITEGMLIRNVERGIGVLTQLKELGVSISMDDFGTGYSSLSYFRTFPFDKVKIDQSFIRDMDENPQSLAIVQAVIGLGRGLDMLIVAEGVESDVQLRRLRDEGCDIVQGYHIGKPANMSLYRDVVVVVDNKPKIGRQAA